MGSFDADDFSTVLQGKHDPTPPEEGSFVLTVTSGPELGRTFEIDGSPASPVFLGQGPSCELKVTDREVSRRHLSLELEGQRLHVRDLETTNGTYVNGVQVVDALLAGGEEIRVGATTLRVARQTVSHPRELTTESTFGRVFGASREMRRLYDLLGKLAAAQVSVAIEGETGTGKEVLAESLHEMGPRASGPFVVFDCTAVAPNLVESELFGHERGAFTGALATRKGVFEQAHGGTLLIDEIGDMPLDLQPKLLRVLERSEVRRVGGDRVIKVDVRVLSATRRNLDREVQAGRFRDDLYHRLAVARVELPPLRKRRGDVPALAQKFWSELGGAGRPMPPELLARWETHAWPGNVRELRNAVATAVALGVIPEMTGDAELELADQGSFAKLLEATLDAKLPLVQARQRVVAMFERRYVERLLADHGGNVVRAAAASGIARRHFHRLKARFRT